MALGTITGTTNNPFIDCRISWSSKADNSTNKSTVTASLQYKRNNSGYQTYGTGSFSLTIGGTKWTETKYITITNDDWVTAITVKTTISHGSDGKKSVSMSAIGGIDGTTLDATSCSGTATLDTIPRASTITSAADKILTNYCSVKWTPLSTSFGYKLKFSLGDWSHTTGVISPNTTSAYTYTGYILPLEVANQLPKAKTGTMTVTLYTYSSSSATTQVGSASSKTFTITVPDNSSTKPTVTMSLSPVSSLGSTFSSLYIQGKSKVKATLSAEGKYKASISSYSMQVQGKTYGSPYQSDYLTASGTVSVSGKATDSRGFSSTKSQSITVIPYSKPKLLPASGESAIICARCDKDGNLSDSGTYLKIKAKRSYAKVTSSGEQKNFCLIRYRYRTESASSFSAWKTILAKTTTSTDTVDTTLSGVVSSTTTAYVVQVGVADDIGETDAVQFNIPTDFVTLDIPEAGKGRRIGIGRYAEKSDEPGIDMGMPIHGGAVDNLMLGEMITATSASPIDLDDCKTPGCYYSPNADNSQHIVNSPYNGGGFGLEVREIQNSTYIRQEMYFGRTRWTRHWNGEEWSNWLRYLMTSQDETSCSDYVIESGTSEGWTYKKWKSGTYEMFGYFDVTPTQCAQRTGGVIYRTDSIGIKAPFKIKSACASGTVMGYCWLSNSGISTDHEFVAIRLLSAETISTSASVEVRLAVTGTYE